MKDIMIVVITCVLAIIVVGFSYASRHRDEVVDESTKETAISEQQKYEELENRLRKLELDLYMQGQTLKRISEKLEGGNN